MRSWLSSRPNRGFVRRGSRARVQPRLDFCFCGRGKPSALGPNTFGVKRPRGAETMIDSQKTAADVKQTTLEALEAQDESFAFQESDLGIMPGTASQHSRTQPNNDVVLRIECITDRQMKVRWCSLVFTSQVCIHPLHLQPYTNMGDNIAKPTMSLQSVYCHCGHLAAFHQ